MAKAAAVAIPRSSSPPRVQINWDPPLFLNLLAPAVLLGFLRMWSTWIAPKYGIYFTSEAILIAYAYFATARAVFLYTHSTDRDGRYDKARAKQAEQDFYREFNAHRPWLTSRAAPLLALPLVADLLTARTNIPWLYVTLGVILLAEYHLWRRFGPAFIVASARWSATRPFDLAAARRLVQEHRLLVASSFRFPTVAFVGVALFALLFYKRIGKFLLSVVPSSDIAFFYSVTFFSCLAWFALWLHCRWSARILPRLTGPVSLDEIAGGGRDLRRNPRLRWLLSAPTKRG